MPSERRLHPYSVLFAFLTQIRLFVVPGILVVLGASSRGGNDWWQPWMMVMIVPTAGFAFVRYLTYRYRYDASELVIRSGLLFRRERHIPYARIQNIDAVQNLLHRALNVVEVKIETGGSETAEATMSVLPVAAYREMRERVFADRHAADRQGEKPAEAAAPAPTALLALNVRELLICGFIENRGGVLIAAAFGLVWELGLFDRLMAGALGEQDVGRGALRDLARSIFTNATISWSRIAWMLAAFVALLALLRVVSMIWAAVRLYGFRLTLVDDDARSEFGLLTRVALTIPLRRVQALTVRESPLHRRFGRVAVKVATAGGKQGEAQSASDREYLAPILPRPALDDFVRTIVGVDLASLEWRAPHPRAFRREVKGWLFVAVLLAVGVAAVARWYALVAAPLLVMWAAFAAHKTIEHLRWAECGDAVVLRTGWLWRRVVVARLAKIQVVTMHESPFDRRNQMAAVHVDTAGASEGSVVRIPYMPQEAAAKLHARLAAAAAGTQFRW